MSYSIYTAQTEDCTLTFNRHQSFYFREGWLRKGMKAVTRDPYFFLRDDADEILGLGRNMVASLRYWMVATGMADEVKVSGRYCQVITPIGQIIMNVDPYFESIGTLWITHSLLASNIEHASTWYWFFNRYAKTAFDKEDFLEGLQVWVASNGKEIARDSLSRDFECFVKTYLPSEGTPEDILVCPLGSLGILDVAQESGTDVLASGFGKRNLFYRFNKPDIEELDPLIVGWSLLRWQRRFKPDTSQISFFEAIRENLSPGRLFNLSAHQLLELLNRLKERHPDLAYRVIRSNRLDLIEMPNAEPDDYIKQFYKTEGY